MPAIKALISKSKLRPTYSPQSPCPAKTCSCAGEPCFACVPVCRKGAALASPFARARRRRRAIAGYARQVAELFRRLRCGLLPHAFGERHRLVGALQEFDGHEDHLLVAEIFEIVDLEFAGPVGLVPRVAGCGGVFGGGAGMDLLASAAR